MSGILIFLFLLVHTPPLIISKTPTIHNCQVEPYTETINLQNCLNTPLSIETTRCRGQCYSQDYLVYDWQYAPTHYRHIHHLHCCSPKNTKAHEIQIMCENKKPRTIQYRIVTQCECKKCNDRCME
ncbi:unnamed protein product [Rotaria sp. Silwood1]|nr:unnamed protein product [Rotaria sp. Silwood1]CAF0833505.1 unnamed protein product [Rotaria sp. Silwood1]CAF0931364.1 unnamed protein product [Rotaria sp. Silwood1]CAF3339018.1 unnamed protein product [Rotaria sp. Silwood1]CAF3361352.1 unnamed protein product [Rotaria sp. Silwood1]